MARLHREVLEKLFVRIVDGEFPAGTMLPKETLIAEQYDVSRGVARECIRALEERGVVSVKHGRGATVRPDGAWNVLDPLLFSMIRSTSGGRRLLSEAVEARAMVVGETAARAAERARPKTLRALTAAVDQVENLPGPASEAEFHRALGEVAGNRPLARTVLSIVEAMDGAPRQGHRAVLEAVEAGNAEAAREAARRLSGA